jgi:integrase
MAAIRRRGDMQYQAEVRKKGYPAQRKTFIYKEDAILWGKETEVKIERGLFFDRTTAEKTTMMELFERYKTDILPSLAGRGSLPALNALTNYFKKYAVSSVTSEMIVKYRNKRLESVKSGTVRKELGLLSKIIDIAGKEWGCPVAVNPCTNVKKPAEGKGRDRRLEGTEEKYLLYSCADSSAALEAITIIAIESASRLGELLELNWKYVDLNKRTMKFFDTKNGEDRNVPLSSCAVAAFIIIQNMPKHISGRVFYRWKASDSFTKIFARACKRAGIENLHFHDLRHEACSRLADKFHMHELMKITGHKSSSMLARYYHPRAEDLAKKLA